MTGFLLSLSGILGRPHTWRGGDALGKMVQVGKGIIQTAVMAGSEWRVKERAWQQAAALGTTEAVTQDCRVGATTTPPAAGNPMEVSRPANIFQNAQGLASKSRYGIHVWNEWTASPLPKAGLKTPQIEAR